MSSGQPNNGERNVNTLYFVKFQSGTDQAVFLVTADGDGARDDAECQARQRLTTPSRWTLAECTPVCCTPDDVLCFEPC